LRRLAAAVLLLYLAVCTAVIIVTVGSTVSIMQAFKTGSAKGPQTVIVVLVEFPDRKHSVSTEAIRQIVFNNLNAFYREASYGLMSVTGDITSKWYQTQTPLSKLNLQEWTYNENDMKLFEKEAIESADNDVNYRQYDFVILVAAGEVWPHAACRLAILARDTGLRGVVVNEESPLGTYAHELGHVLPSNYEPRQGCGLPDLYSYDASEKGHDPNIFVGPWDIMGENNPPRRFSAWSMMEFGWITPEIINVGTSLTMPIALQPLESDSGVRVLVLPISETLSYVVEVRRQIGSDMNLPSEGVLVYFVDLSKDNGCGPVRVIDSHPETPTLDDAPYKQGALLASPQNNTHLAVSYADGVGYLMFSGGSNPPFATNGNARTVTGELLSGREEYTTLVLGFSGESAPILYREND
jgi:M6 family metalloprotease-like protein